MLEYSFNLVLFEGSLIDVDSSTGTISNLFTQKGVELRNQMIENRIESNGDIVSQVAT